MLLLFTKKTQYEMTLTKKVLTLCTSGKKCWCLFAYSCFIIFELAFDIRSK